MLYSNRALCHCKLKQWSEVMADCGRALELDPSLVKAHFMLGQAKCEAGAFDDAVSSLTAGKLSTLLKETTSTHISLFFQCYVSVCTYVCLFIPLLLTIRKKNFVTHITRCLFFLAAPPGCFGYPLLEAPNVVLFCATHIRGTPQDPLMLSGMQAEMYFCS